MTERQLQFRVGLFTIFAIVAGTAMVITFGKLDSLFEKSYVIAVHYTHAPGVFAGTPVRKNGVSIGRVTDVLFDDEHGGVLLVTKIRGDVKLRIDATPHLARTLLGDSSINFEPGSSDQFLPPNARLEGTPPVDPMDIVNNFERQLSKALASFEATSSAWRELAVDTNGLINNNQEKFQLVLDRAAASLHEFSKSMQGMQQTIANANSLVGDPRNQEAIRKTISALPLLVTETRQIMTDTRKILAETKQAVTVARTSLGHVDENLENLKHVTKPLAERTASTVAKLESTLTNMESFSKELNEFIEVVNSEDGSLQKLAKDPALYRNLNRSAESLSILLTNLSPIIRDMRVFSDKVARHPELIGVGGVFRGSDGLKAPEPTTSVPESVPPPRISGSTSRGGQSSRR
ncbi:MlaD family protein [Calycomorphotria hydatis]|uniref:Mce related protein n=1 Tax=Calycomorphotria hydatis TaxID=2528027 RepID=A0A517TAR9_9PLAN|nr:MlaD family protein [Calycomorphotria hydatis]QDT65460.1 mce related protein [Calycomorphotria hydatis]